MFEGHLGQTAWILGQAPGVVEGEERRPWRGRAGQTFRRWLDMDEGAVLRDFLLLVRHAATRADTRADAATGRRARASSSSAASGSTGSPLLRPRLVVPVGGLAIKRVLGISGLAGCIGSRFELGDAVAVPLPHPSGASGWLNSLENRKCLGAGPCAPLRAEL